MRVFLGPDDRKIAAKKKEQPSLKSSEQEKGLGQDQDQELQQPSRKKRKSGDCHLKINSKNNNNNSNSSSNMGGGGRLMDRPTEAAAAWKSGGDTTEQELPRISNVATTTMTARGNRNTDGSLMNRGTHVNGASAAVAAAASSPHRSTLNSAHRNSNINTQNSNPEEEEEWQGNDSKQSSRCIYLGKSNDDNSHHSRRHYKSTALSSSSMQPSVPAPLLNGPIPGSMDDPATMSKTNEDENDQENANYDNVDDDNSTLSQFIHLLRTQHKPPLDMVEMEGDGNCLFRAISLQVYGDASMHLEVRRHCLDFMEREADHFRNFVADEEFGEYIARKRMEGVHGNHTEIQAMSELYNRSIEVFVPSTSNHDGSSVVEPINIFHSEYKSDDAPIRLCYMDGNHYNAVTDPLLPTAGLGLGLPGLQPGLADKLQLDQAKKISDESAMEEKMRLALEESHRASKAREEIEMKEAMRKSSELENANVNTAMDSDDDVYKKKAMYLSEMEAADFDLEQAVLASSLESYQKAQQERKQPSLRRGEGRRSRFNSSPRSQRSSSTSPVHRSNNAAAATSSASSSSNQYAVAAAAAASSSVASLPNASAQAVASRTMNDMSITADEYPASVQELVMNGFVLSKVLHAYDLIGDNFDDLLSFLLSTTAS